MSPFHEMLRKITSSSYHDKVLQFAKPLSDYLGINHFWYYQITYSGHYSYLGTHGDWNEFCFDNAMLQDFSCLRHPKALRSGINLMKSTTDPKYQSLLQTAWEKFNINFCINLLNKTENGVEAFGFASKFNDSKADERLLNELPLLRHFTIAFRTRHQKVFNILNDQQIDLAAHFGPVFFEKSKELVLTSERVLFLRKLGFEIEALTPREMDVLKLISSGFPAAYIGKELHLSRKTIENYIATIKCKLSCHSKVELIKKAQEIVSLIEFD